MCSYELVIAAVIYYGKTNGHRGILLYRKGQNDTEKLTSNLLFDKTSEIKSSFYDHIRKHLYTIFFLSYTRMISNRLSNRLFSHNVVTMETSAIGWPSWLITFWYLCIWRNHVNAQCMSMYNCFEIQRYQNVINQDGQPIALVSMVTTLWEKSLYKCIKAGPPWFELLVIFWLFCTMV